MRSIRKRFIILSLLIISTFVLCGYSIRGASMVELEVWDSYDSDFSTFNTFKLDGEFITIPCEVSVLNELGFDFKQNEEIEPYSMDNMNYMYNKRGDRIMVDLINLSDSMVTFNDCVVVEISYDEQEGSTLGFDYKGITLGSTIEECEQALGRAKYVSTIYDGVYTATFSSPKDERTAMLSFYKDDKLIGFHIECDRPLDLEVNGYHPVKTSSKKTTTTTINSDGSTTITEQPMASESFSIAIVLISVIFCILLPFGIVIFVFVFIFKQIRKMREDKYDNEVRKAREVRRVLETPIEDIDTSNELKDKWL